MNENEDIMAPARGVVYVVILVAVFGLALIAICLLVGGLIR